MKKKVLIVFAPVLHKGYLSLFKKYPEDIRFLGKDFIKDHTSLSRDLRIIDPALLVNAVKSLKIAKKLAVLKKSDIKNLVSSEIEIIMPNEDVSFALAEKYFKNKKVKYENVFLRWDKIISTAEFVIPEKRKKTSDLAHKQMLAKAFEEAGKSSDWWRRIGAVVTNSRGEILIVSHNRHIPTDYHLYTFGDPRSNFNAGQSIDICTAIHGEADVIAKAAKQGVSLNNCSIYVTTFPCPNCARLIGEAGINKVYYSNGYSRLDAEEVLNNYGVEIYLVE